MGERNQKVDVWFEVYTNPQKPLVLAVRDVILGVDATRALTASLLSAGGRQPRRRVDRPRRRATHADDRRGGRAHERLLGAPLPRQDGLAKATGAARYAAGHFAAGMLYGVLVGAPVAARRLRAIDADAARDIPGVARVLTRAEVPKLGAPPVPPASSVRVTMQDDEIR